LFPSIIPSPANVLKWQKGDCFDMSIVLVSLLTGVGFDAYVVIGKAPKEITIQNESRMEYKNSQKGLIKSEVFENDEFAELQKKNEFAI
jgi:transglutaminase-like putative cysteine protease